MSDDIISKKGEVVGQWNGESVEDLKKTLLSIKQDLRKKGDKVEHTGVPHSEQFPDDLKARVMQGPTELSLVRSGLDDTMRTGYKAMSDRFHSDKRIKSLRMASMVIAIERIAESYVSLGI